MSSVSDKTRKKVYLCKPCNENTQESSWKVFDTKTASAFFGHHIHHAHCCSTQRIIFLYNCTCTCVYTLCVCVCACACVCVCVCVCVWQQEVVGDHRGVWSAGCWHCTGIWSCVQWHAQSFQVHTRRACDNSRTQDKSSQMLMYFSSIV